MTYLSDYFSPLSHMTTYMLMHASSGIWDMLRSDIVPILKLPLRENRHVDSQLNLIGH